MRDEFDRDLFPGGPKILFIGFGESSHTHAWIDLLRNSEFNVRLFSLPSGVPPDDWLIKTYVSGGARGPFDSAFRLSVFSRQHQLTERVWRHAAARFSLAPPRVFTLQHALAKILRSWRPDIVHTLGFDPAAYLYLETRNMAGARGDERSIGRWVAQARGGPDLAVNWYDPKYTTRIQQVVRACDYFVADNQPNYDFAVRIGLDMKKLGDPPLGPVPGTGGMPVDELREWWRGSPPSTRGRSIVWPKAYETASAKALPVLEAIKLAWERIKPCEIHMLWLVQAEVKSWFHKMMPDEVQAASRLYNRLPREQALDLMRQARVLLAPSLTDGVPNSMLEAMSLGAFPIVSPLDTITPVVEAEANVLFARNLYPDEIAAALVRAMTDDGLVDSAARANLALVRKLVDRGSIGHRVIAFYEGIIGHRGSARELDAIELRPAR
jgi:hypothetical protein